MSGPDPSLALGGLQQPDFLRLAQKSLRRGVAWTTDPDANLTQVLNAKADTAYAVHGELWRLLAVEMDPSQTVEMLPDWERNYGLPDPCLPLNPTIGQRHASLLARIAARGGQSEVYYEAIAAALGYAITIETFTPSAIGSAAIGDPIYTTPWSYAWRVTTPGLVIVDAAIGQSSIGDPIRSWGSRVLECELTRIKPAHTILQFAYTD